MADIAGWNIMISRGGASSFLPLLRVGISCTIVSIDADDATILLMAQSEWVLLNHADPERSKFRRGRYSLTSEVGYG